MTELFSEIRPELFVLIPVLYVLGVLLKKSTLADWKIPFLLCAFGALLSFLYLAGQEGLSDWPTLLFSSLTQGVLCASCSVYVKNLCKQWKERDGDAKQDGDT